VLRTILSEFHRRAMQRRAAAKGKRRTFSKLVPVLAVPGGKWYGRVDALLTAEKAEGA
jgi:hypothetical protein